MAKIMGLVHLADIHKFFFYSAVNKLSIDKMQNTFFKKITEHKIKNNKNQLFLLMNILLS